LVLRQDAAVNRLRAPHAELLLGQRRAEGAAVIVRRVIGWIFVLAGLAVLARDATVRIDTGRWAPIALGQLWYELDRSSLNLVQAVIQRYVSPFLWNPVIVDILLCWTFAVLLAVGAVILLLTSRRRSRRIRSKIVR